LSRRARSLALLAALAALQISHRQP